MLTLMIECAFPPIVNGNQVCWFRLEQISLPSSIGAMMHQNFQVINCYQWLTRYPLEYAVVIMNCVILKHFSMNICLKLENLVILKRYVKYQKTTNRKFVQ